MVKIIVFGVFIAVALITKAYFSHQRKIERVEREEYEKRAAAKRNYVQSHMDKFGVDNGVGNKPKPERKQTTRTQDFFKEYGIEEKSVYDL